MHVAGIIKALYIWYGLINIIDYQINPWDNFHSVLGFQHEQNRNDRDDYIEIDYDAIKQVEQENFLRPNSFRNQFRKCNLTRTGKRWGCKRINNYYLESILHYSNTYLERSTPRIFKAKVNCSNEECDFGQRRELSRLDVSDIEELYKCGRLV